MLKVAHTNKVSRGTVKTYTRQRACREKLYEAGERPRKRICMGPNGHVIERVLNNGAAMGAEPIPEVALEKDHAPKPQDIETHERASSTTIPSSPPAGQRMVSSPGAFSSGSELSSLPSSPPPMPSPLPKTRKPTFSFLKRKRDASDVTRSSKALTDITANIQKDPRQPKKAMTQMQIDLGGDVRKKCRACGMEYIPSVKEDANLHREYCNMNIGGIEMGKTFSKDESLKMIRSKKVLASDKEAIMMVDRRCCISVRHKAQKALDVVNAELNAATLADGALWSEDDASSGGKQLKGTRKSGVAAEKKTERFKIFLHMVSDKCVGFCLAEKISQAYRVVSDETGSQKENSSFSKTCKSSSILHSTAAEVALLGISRIWTSKSYRGQGFGTNLLECARSNFFYGIEVPKNLVAFSQPTESGGKLAKRWFGSDTSWHVYSESQA